MNSLVSVVIPTYNRKAKLKKLLETVQQSNYPKIEIIVVDDASTDGTSEYVQKKFPNVKIIRNKKERLLAASRNIGIKNSKGDCIFLIDDDNRIDKNCIALLAETLADKKIGAVMPIMFHFHNPKKVWCAGVKRNMITSITRFITFDYEATELIETDDFPNAFMIRKDVVEKIGLLDEKHFPIHYDEADYGERMRKNGFRVVCNPRAKIWHDYWDGKGARNKTITSKMRAFYSGRNRIIFQKKHSKWWQFIIFAFVFHPLINIRYLYSIVKQSSVTREKTIGLFVEYVKGICSGTYNVLSEF